MDFFKSVFSEEPDPPKCDSGSDPDTPTEQREPSPNPELESTSRWSFGGLVRTLAVKSESVIQTYRRDLQEFSTGLKKEIEVVQGSLETVGHAIDEMGSNVMKGTAQIFSHGKEVVLAPDLESDSSDSTQNRSFNSKQYSRFDAQVRAIQGDVRTYCEEPEDLSDYSKWKSVFGLEENKEEIESLLKENEAMESVYRRVVPGSVDHQTFWCRYFYKVYKLKQTEELRAKLVNRTISTAEEELSWDFDDSEEEKENNLVAIENREMEKKTADDIVEITRVATTKVEGTSTDVQGMGEDSRDDSLKNYSLAEKDSDMLGKKDNTWKVASTTTVVNDKVGKAAVESSTKPADDNEELLGKSSGVNKEDAETKPDEKKMILEEKSDHGRESSKGSDYSVVSSQPSTPEEDDLGWDEIEDLSSIDDDKKTIEGGSCNRADLRKRLSVAKEEEDLSWDIEDDE